MAVARNTIPHLRLVFGGTSGSSGGEIWANTLRLIPAIAGTPPVPPSQSQAAASVAALSATDLQASVTGPMKTAVSAMWNVLGGNSFYLDYVKLNAFGTNDLQVTDPTVETQFTPIQGPVFCSTPWSSALDFYHRTSGASRGFATHGRLSLPTGLVVSSGTGKVTGLGSPTGTDISLATCASTWVTFLDAVRQASPGSGWYPAVIYTSTTTAKPPKSAIIDRFLVSDIPGEVRTRQNALKQGSAKVTVPYS